MVTTKDYAKKDTTEFVAVARRLIPLDDPDAYGNFGLQGLDEEYENSKPFADLAGAEAWMRWAFSEWPDAVNVEIDCVEYVADVFDDDRYGRIYDAIGERTRTWIWMLDDEGPMLDEEYDPR